MKWLIDCYNPEGQYLTDIPWVAPTADEAVKEFEKINPKARLDCIKPGSILNGMDHFEPSGLMAQLKKNQEERIRDIFGMSKEEDEKLKIDPYSVSVKLTPEALERCRESIRKQGIGYGQPIYLKDIEEDEPAMLEKEIYAEVGRFFKRKS